MSRLQRVRQNLRKAYDTGRESVRLARADHNGDTDSDHEIDFDLPAPEPPVDHQSTSSQDDAEVPHSLRISAAWCSVYMTIPRSWGRTATRYSRPYRASLPMPTLPFIPSRMTAKALAAMAPSGAR